ncbi:hypothetical protein [Actinocorallia longicatena]|uniref:DUF916 domain-containing protein n=1 Tax=Actinocorallia longicatena TaxID=111803 RepID=A0ABP6Q1P2_9ACTN
MAALAVPCLVAVLVPGPVAASDTPGFGLQVSPTRLVVPQGTISTARTFKIANKGRSPFVVTVEASDFTSNTDGALKFLADAPFAASSWASVSPSRFAVPPGATRNVKLELSIPEDPEPGDHQFALIFKVPAGRGAANIRINRGIAAPVYVTVPGPVDSSVRVAGLHAPDFVLGGPVRLTARIQDTGTVHRDFRGPGRLGIRAGGARVAFPDFTVPRGSTREVQATWNPPLLCVCHARLSLPGRVAEPATATVRVIVLPLHLFGAVLGGLAVVLVIAWFARRRYRNSVRIAAEEIAGGR